MYIKDIKMSNYYHNYQSKYSRTRGYYGELVQEGKLWRFCFRNQRRVSWIVIVSCFDSMIMDVLLLFIWRPPPS